MNGWAKLSGILAAVAGIVYVIAVVLALADGLSFGTDDLASFASNSKYTYITALAGIFAFAAGASAVYYGITIKGSMVSILGIILAIVGGVIIVSGAKEGLTNISWHAMGVSLYASLFVLAFAVAFAAASVKKYQFAIIAVLLAFCIDAVYVLNIVNGMLVPLLGAIVFIFAGVFLLLLGKEKFEFVEADADNKSEIVVVPLDPAKPAMPAPAPVAKPAPAEPAEEPKPAAKKAEAAKPAEKAKVEEEAKPAPAPVAAAPAESKPAEESEDDKILRQGYETVVTKVGDDKAAAMSDEEIVAAIKAEDAELYTKVSAITGIVIADAVSEPAPVEESEDDKILRQGYETVATKVGDDKAAAMSDEEIVAVVKSEDEELYTKVSAITGIVVEDESEDDKILRQGWETTVKAVGEERANELTDYEIVAVTSEVDPELYAKVSAITGIVVAAEVMDEAMTVEEEEDPFELNLEPTTPAGFLRRACWNKGLRCRKNYGPYYIPVAFVKSKVAVYIDGPTPDTRNDENLRNESWVVLHFPESKITNGAEEAQIVYEAVKENTRALKKAKAKKKKKR